MIHPNLWARFEFRHGRRACFEMRALYEEIQALPEVPMNTLCANPDCGAFFEAGQPPVPHLDRETKNVVLLCRSCTRYFAQRWSSRYVEVDPGEKSASASAGRTV